METSLPEYGPFWRRGRVGEVSMHEGFGPGPQSSTSSAANHGDVHAGAGQRASPMNGTDEPDLHQQSSWSFRDCKGLEK